jgi:hypothetical protein
VCRADHSSRGFPPNVVVVALCDLQTSIMTMHWPERLLADQREGLRKLDAYRLCLGRTVEAVVRYKIKPIVARPASPGRERPPCYALRYLAVVLSPRSSGPFASLRTGTSFLPGFQFYLRFPSHLVYLKSGPSQK